MEKKSSASKGRDEEKESPLLCIFFVCVVFVGQEDLNILSRVEAHPEVLCCQRLL